MGHNAFSDMTHQEFAAFVGLTEIADEPGFDSTDMMDANVQGAEIRHPGGIRKLMLPATVDWRSMTTVRDQGGCGSAWAFTTADAVEALLKIKRKQTDTPLLSAQQLVDCVYPPASSALQKGCSAGWPTGLE
jgi:C1A family cysteine protease